MQIFQISIYSQYIARLLLLNLNNECSVSIHEKTKIKKSMSKTKILPWK